MRPNVTRSLALGVKKAYSSLSDSQILQPSPPLRIVKSFLARGGRKGSNPVMEDYLRWKATFNGRQPLMKDKLLWNKTFYGIRPLMEKDL